MTIQAQQVVRVAYLVADLAVGGIQSMVGALGRGLDRERYRPAFVSFDGKGAIAEQLERDGFEVRLVPRLPGLDLALPSALRRTFAELGTDVVHAHNRTALFHAVLARGFRSRPRLVYTEHDRSFPEALKVRWLHAVLSRRLDAAVAVCGAVRDAIVATERFPAERTHVVVNGVADPGIAGDRAAARRAIAAELGFPADAPLVLAIGHLTPVKDHATLLEAIGRIAPIEFGESGRRPVLVIAGDGELRGALESQRRRLGLDACVHLPGYRRDIDRLLLACDVLAMSSRSEGLSIALVEAAARGVPIVATDVGGNAEVVADGENGLLVPRGDPAVLGAAIERLLGDSTLREAMGRAGRQRYLDRFRLATMIERYAAIYSRLG